MCLTVFIVLLPIFIIVIFVILMLCPTGIRSFEAIEEKDGCWKKLAGHLIDSLRPVLKVNESTQSENAHLPVVKAESNNKQLASVVSYIKNRFTAYCEI